MRYTVFDFFTDSVLRAPTWGSMLMCLASSLVGVIVVLRKRSLVGEALSHAAYPGVVLGVMIAALYMPFSDKSAAIVILIGASVFACIGLLVIEALIKKLHVSSDAALCFVLSSFLGVGILFASRLQMTHVVWYRQIQVFLYGQAATMTDIHIVIYGCLALLVILFIGIWFNYFRIVIFDPGFATSTGIGNIVIDILFFALLILAIVIGVRSVGIVLMSGMLVAPAVAAKQITKRLSTMLIVAGLVGMFSGFFGTYLSVQMPYMVRELSGIKFSLPTGPMIILVAASLAFISLCFSPDRGVFTRWMRSIKFRYTCFLENLLKTFWKKHPQQAVSFQMIQSWNRTSSLLCWFALHQLCRQGWLKQEKDLHFMLTIDGQKKAARIVRLHRLWEVYLANYLGLGGEKIHRSAEEMEHIIVPEIEEVLMKLLNDPQEDPHKQPIPPKEAF